MRKLNVESFDLNHRKVVAPYVRLEGTKQGIHGDEVLKYDLRFTQPNKLFMKMDVLHSIEQLMAENVRNHSDNVVDISPMGCQTSFYISDINHDDFEGIFVILEKTLRHVLVATEMQCEWAASHSLEGAKVLARNMLAKKDEWRQVYKEVA